MKKVFAFIGAAMFVAAMTVACGHKTAEAVDSTVEENVEEAVQEVNTVEAATMSDAEHQAMLDAAAEAGRAKCNCYKTDAASVESCIKSCVKEKATSAVKEATNEGIKAGANALADKLNKKK